MRRETSTTFNPALRRTLGLALVVGFSVMTSACSSLTGEEGLDLMASAKPEADAAAADAAAVPQSDLEKATSYWAKEYAKAPQNENAALSYARNLKAMGRKQEAFTLLQQAVQLNNSSKPLAAEYGRLALDFDQTSLASQLLEFADDPMKPDWRVISARGAALAKLGKYKEAVGQLERAQLLAPGQASVQNNLALAYAMSGEPQKAEGLLRKAIATDASNAKTRQNLALVLGLQGKYDEATQVGSTAVAADVARENTALVRQIVKLEPKAAPMATPVPSTALAAAPAVKPAPVALKPAAIDNGSAASSWNSTVVSSAP